MNTVTCHRYAVSFTKITEVMNIPSLTRLAKKTICVFFAPLREALFVSNRLTQYLATLPSHARLRSCITRKFYFLTLRK